MDPALRSNGYVIPGSDSYLFYRVNNVAGSNATVFLPHANAAGKMVILLAANTASSSGVTLAVQGGSALVTNVTGATGQTKASGVERWIGQLVRVERGPVAGNYETNSKNSPHAGRNCCIMLIINNLHDGSVGEVKAKQFVS